MLFSAGAERNFVHTQAIRVPLHDGSHRTS